MGVGVFESKFKVGEIVSVRDFDSCVFGIHPSMRKFTGRMVTISYVRWHNGYRTYRYEIVEDGGAWWWSDECFEHIPVLDLPDFTAESSLDILLS